ncbi:MAG: hypothetical protein GY948_15580 [Alphaproteobacteria bacterium]|nr:hypothetical protein [Alphaproteobacteria bacterium]
MAIKSASLFDSFWRRLGDNKNIPRRWWYPPREPGTLDSDILKDQHSKCSETIRRTMITMLSSSFFFLLTMFSVPDRFFIIASEPALFTQLGGNGWRAVI